MLALEDDADLQAQVAAAQASLDKAVAAYQKLLDGVMPEDRAVAQASVDSAQSALADAQRNVAATQASSGQDVAVAQTGVESARVALDNAQRNLAEAVLSQNQQDIAAAQVGVQSAQAAYQNAQRNLVENVLRLSLKCVIQRARRHRAEHERFECAHTDE